MNPLTAALLGMGVDEVRESYLKLPFAWPGGKADSLKHILPLLPYGSGYCEPFGGSGVVMLNRSPSKLEVYNDRYGGVTAFFRVVRDRALFPLFMERVEATVHSREEFIWCKKTWKNCEDDVERAARWYYMIRFAVNGKAQSTFGRSKDPKVCFADRLYKSLPMFGPLHSRLRTVTIENQDWRLLMDDFDQPGMVWYLDPTYLDSSTGTYEHELSVADHVQLVTRVAHMKSFVAVSSYDTPTTRQIYDKVGVWDDKVVWPRTTTALTQAFTESNGLARKETVNDRSKVDEVLWIRNRRN